jgi:hypothetical protein
MRLILLNGYPFPYPQGLTEAESDAINDAAKDKSFEINGIFHFEWLHTLTIEFVDQESYETSQELTGWQRWADHTLEATTSGPEGYGHPAIIVKDTAYCGFILKEE